MEYTGKKIFTSFIWKFLERTSVQLTTFIVTILLARILTPQEFGAVAIIVIFVNLANVIVEGGLTAALIQKKGTDLKDFSTIFVSSITLAILLYVILYMASPLIASFYNNYELIETMRFLSLMIIPCAINSIQKAFVSKYLLFKEMFISSLIAIVVSGIIGIIMALHDYGIWALTMQVVVNQSLVTILMFFLVPWRPAFHFSIKRFKLLFDFGWKIFLTNFIIAIYEDIRGILIGKFYKPATLAFFDRGKQFPSLIMGNINTSIQTVLFPAFSDSQDNVDKLKRMIKTSSQISCFIVFPLLMFLVISAKPLVIFLLNESWLPSAPFIQIFSIALILMPIQSTNMIAVKSMGYSNITLKIEFLKKIIETIILIISFLFNVYAVAWGIVLYNSICLFINLYPISKLINYSITNQLRDIFPIFIISIISSIPSYFISYTHLNASVIILLQIIFGLVCYVFLSRIFHIEAFSQLTIMLKQYKKLC
ncbi:MAG: lipopolysaccharide biosynthesis protein [Prevotella sp.]|nr:lipopolysaccharide biosynthesis protein [Bacteroides sp.]MCM1366394.1 lipopolysaccharide biosynthesis protein [Prevotella sp.]MCM1436677.1 lipopolysaccharide biosynthesis protein [Prevotella sp.]